DQRDPLDAYHVLDADGSQRICPEAAARGESFVLLGAAGTGKSQTIVNLIADRIAHGQAVLFVSNKTTALEAMERRLLEAGLGELCLELYSDKASREKVVTELARCLQHRSA